jgi:L-rhamnose isomerase/sugar isomerase
VAVHVLWDFPNGLDDTAGVGELAAACGVRIGAVNPNVFQDQIYKYGSLGSPDPAAREAALRHIRDSIEIARRTRSRDISLWFADGSNYPGTANIRRRKQWFTEGLQALHADMAPEMRMLVEYKPFEPAFYHTDIADWGMALLLARAAGPQARVLVDTGHHYQAQNIEQIVAWLLAEDMLGGFHFNDRRYADDDLTLGSIDPYQVFRIFQEIALFEFEAGRLADVAYMIDQSHNLKNKIEEMIQTVTTAQELYGKAAAVDYEALVAHQQNCSLIDAEECLKNAFSTDVRPLIREWRASKGLPQDPLRALRESGYLERISEERAARNQGAVSTYA